MAVDDHRGTDLAGRQRDRARHFEAPGVAQAEVALDPVLVAEDDRAAVGEQGGRLAGLVALGQRRHEAHPGCHARLGQPHGRVAEGVGGDHDPAGGGVGQDDAVLAVGRGLEQAGECSRGLGGVPPTRAA